MEPNNLPNNPPIGIPIHPEIARPRQEGDIDLVTETHNRLKAAGCTLAESWLDHPEIVQAKDAPPALQRILVARNLQEQFLALPLDTRAARILLNATTDPVAFLDEIEQHIAPEIKSLEPLHAEIEAQEKAAAQAAKTRRGITTSVILIDESPFMPNTDKPA